jgi:hypothetical protein
MCPLNIINFKHYLLSLTVDHVIKYIPLESHFFMLLFTFKINGRVMFLSGGSRRRVLLIWVVGRIDFRVVV